MIIANIEWLGTCCTFLSLICAAQLLITGTLAFSVSEVLLLTGTHLSTGTGLIAGLIALPTALRLKTAQISPNMDRIYGYTLCYQQLAVCISLILHLTAIICVIGAFALTGDLQNDLLYLMTIYKHKHASKTLIDNIQYILQCCGANAYKDWFNIHWSQYRPPNERIRKDQSIQNLLQEDDSEFNVFSPERSDLVPYSCCAKSVLSVCIHQNLMEFGVFTINTCGCGKKLLLVVHIVLSCELLMYISCLALEIAIFILLRRHSVKEKIKCKRQCRSQDNWEKFSNAEIVPSSHCQIKMEGR